VNDDAEDIDFGDFEGGETTERDVPIVAATADDYDGLGNFDGGAATIEDDFGDFGDGGKGEATALPHEDLGAAKGDDGFGDFEGIVEDDADGTGAAVTGYDDGFGDFDGGVAATIDVVAHAADDAGFGNFEDGELAAAVEEDDGFGDFEGTVPTDDANDGSDCAADDRAGDAKAVLFDAFASSNDAPPPSSSAIPDVAVADDVVFDAFASSNDVAPPPSSERHDAGLHGLQLRLQDPAVDGIDDSEFGTLEGPDTVTRPEDQGHVGATDCDAGESDVAAALGIAASSNDHDATAFDAFNGIPPPPLGGFPLAQKQDDGEDVFGDFGGPTEAAPSNAEGDNNGFGEFEAFPAASAACDGNSAEAAVQKNDNEEEDFGRSDAFSAATAFRDENIQDSARQKGNGGPGEDLCSNFGDNVEGYDNCGTFERQGEKAEEGFQAIEEANNAEDESFGNFEAVPEASNDSVQDNDNFGQFEAFPTADAPTADEEEEVNHVSTVAYDKSTQNNDVDEDFGKFDSFPVDTSTANENFGQFDAPANHEELADSNASLPDVNHVSDESNDEKFTGTFGNTDGEITAIESDEFGGGDFGDFSSFEQAKSEGLDLDKKDDFETIVRTKLGHDFGKLLSDWKNVIISSVESDLQRGNRIMDYLANNIPSTDRACIIKSPKLRNHVYGLAEFVRVVRSIASTIGELLNVDKDVDVQESTLNQWNNNAIIADAVVIEHLWAEICSKAVALGIISQAPRLETVVEIRSTWSLPFNDFYEKEKCCQLTLQPFEEGSCTKSPVVWNGKKYMACAANYCANRVPDHVI